MGTAAGVDMMTPCDVGEDDLMVVYRALLASQGHQNWWPSEGRFETMIGAILAQNVSWSGASRAVSALKEADLLSAAKISALPSDDLASLIWSSRFYRQKSEKLKRFTDLFLSRWSGSIGKMNEEETSILRKELLSLKGFGPETVDSILLYALDRPVFVVDAYTRRIGSRLGWFGDDAGYDEMQQFFSSRLPSNPPLFNDFHAQIVRLGSVTCRTKPGCITCPLQTISHAGFSPYCRYARERPV